MSEPTPLSAERPYSRDELVHLAENMRHSTVQQIVGATEQKTINRLLATIDAQATEIAALKGALQLIADGDCDFENGHDDPLDCAQAIARRVLAGKEAQGG